MRNHGINKQLSVRETGVVLRLEAPVHRKPDMIDALDYIPVAATAFAVPEFLPQILKLRATRDTAGVSWPWAALTSLNNAAWLVYFTLAHYWTALIPSCSATLLAATLVLLLSARGQARLRPSIPVGVWAAMLVAAYLVRVATADLAAYQVLRDEKLAALPGVQRLSSTIVMKRIVDDRPYPTLPPAGGTHHRQ